MKKFIFVFISVFPILLGLTNPKVADGQFIHFQLSVESEMSTDVVQNLDFGKFISDSGVQRIEKGSSNMGIFEIRGLQNQNVVVTMDPPATLEHSNSDISQRITASLEASYTTGSVQDIEQSHPFSGNNARFTIGDEPTSSATNQSWHSAFVYIYGDLVIGEVPDGVYEGTLVLTVEYQ